jgi:hypothetical protein
LWWSVIGWLRNVVTRLDVVMGIPRPGLRKPVTAEESDRNPVAIWSRSGVDLDPIRSLAR